MKVKQWKKRIIMICTCQEIKGILGALVLNFLKKLNATSEDIFFHQIRQILLHENSGNRSLKVLKSYKSRLCVDKYIRKYIKQVVNLI